MAALLVLAATWPLASRAETPPRLPATYAFAIVAPAPPLPSRLSPAPVPNRDLLAPPAPRPAAGPHFSPSLFTTEQHFYGEGYTPGSTVQGPEERHIRPAPGLSLKVPLQ